MSPLFQQQFGITFRQNPTIDLARNAYITQRAATTFGIV